MAVLSLPTNESTCCWYKVRQSYVHKRKESNRNLAAKYLGKNVTRLICVLTNFDACDLNLFIFFFF
jgi:hypothetical protein